MTHSHIAMLSSTHKLLNGITLASFEDTTPEDDLTENLVARDSSSSSISRAGIPRWTHFKGNYLSFKYDFVQVIENLMALFGTTLSQKWEDRIRYHISGLTYSSTAHQLYLSTETLVLS